MAETEAKKRTGLGALADAGNTDDFSVIDAIGGPRGVIESMLPGVVFVALFVITSNLQLTIGVSAALAVLQVIERDGLLDHATALGERLEQRVAALEHPLIDHVRGRGLLRGIVLTEDIAPAAYDAALQAGFVINAPRPNVIRLVPPLNLSTEQLDSFIDALPAILEQARGTSKENA